MLRSGGLLDEINALKPRPRAHPVLVATGPPDTSGPMGDRVAPLSSLIDDEKLSSSDSE